MSIHFYVLSQASGLKALHFACQLIETAYAAQKEVYVHTSTRDEAERFDALLWTYKEDSFIPHQLLKNRTGDAAPIEIGYEQDAPAHQGTLVNLSRDIPTCFQQFQEIIEIVFNEPEAQQLARVRYKAYRDLGLNIHTHK